jgi:hypothetical protein
VNLDALIRCVSILFVMSLAVERITTLFRRWDIQPLGRSSQLVKDAGAAIWHGSASAVRKKGPRFRERMRTTNRRRPAVDLLTNHVSIGGVPVTDPALRERMIGDANAENTVVIGIALALVAQINAFDGFIKGGAFAHFVQMALTGSASAVGSSFWYDLLGILTQLRRAKQDATKGNLDQKPAGAISADVLLKEFTPSQPQGGAK